MVNTGADKYEITAGEIQKNQFGAFCSKWKMTFVKVTPAAWIVNEKKFWQVPLGPWHVLSWIWLFLGTWGPIFLVKNQFSNIFPAPAWSPFLSVILTDKLACLYYPRI